MMEEYERILPGSAERLLAMVEKQQEHRHKLETSHLESGNRRAWVGLSAATVLCLAVVVCGTTLA